MLREEQFIFTASTLNKSRKSELNKIRVHVKFCSFNTFLLCMVNNTFTVIEI